MIPARKSELPILIVDVGCALPTWPRAQKSAEAPVPVIKPSRREA